MSVRYQDLFLPGLCIKDCVGRCDSSVQKCTTVKTTNWDSKGNLWAFVFGSRTAHICAQHQLSVCFHSTHRSLWGSFSIFLPFCRKISPSWPLFYFDQHDSPSNVDESLYLRSDSGVGPWYSSTCDKSTLQSWLVKVDLSSSTLCSNAGVGRVPGLSIKDCVGRCDSSVQKCTTVRTTNWDSKGNLWAFVFGSRTAHICAQHQLSVCFHSLTAHSVANSRFFCFLSKLLIFFVSTIRQVMWPSHGTLGATLDSRKDLAAWTWGMFW